MSFDAYYGVHFVLLQSLTDTADHVKNYRPKLIVLTGNPATRCLHIFLLLNDPWLGSTLTLQATTSWLCQFDYQETFTSHLRPRHLGEIILFLLSTGSKPLLLDVSTVCRRIYGFQMARSVFHPNLGHSAKPLSNSWIWVKGRPRDWSSRFLETTLLPFSKSQLPPKAQPNLIHRKGHINLSDIILPPFSRN